MNGWTHSFLPDVHDRHSSSAKTADVGGAVNLSISPCKYSRIHGDAAPDQEMPAPAASMMNCA